MKKKSLPGANTPPPPPAALQHKYSMDATLKRLIPVVEPERQNGNKEYKRIMSKNPVRLQSLATQMSFRLDEGNGYCVYRVGVEDDGCHSLLDYQSVADSARVVECIARSLNAVVAERHIIQGEIENVKNSIDNNNNNNNNSDDMDIDNNNNNIIDDEYPVRIKDKNGKDSEPIVTPENPVWGSHYRHDDDDDGDCNVNVEEKKDDLDLLIQKQVGAYTRADLVIHRVETHLLASLPLPLHELVNCSQQETVDLLAAEKKKRLQQQAKATSNNNNGIKNSVLGGESKESEEISVGETMSLRNIRIAVVGNVDAGKSTLIGTLTTSQLDDGRGKSRTAIMKHRHEIESGRTSTATTHLLGFRSSGEPVTGRDKVRAMKRKSEDEIARESYRVITLMDLAGHEKYLKTTIHGVSSGFADHSLILVNARQPPTHMTQHHLHLCCSFGIPVIVVFTKIDNCPDHAFKTCREEVTKMLRSPEVKRTPFFVRNEADIATVMDKLHTLAPMIETSCVSGKGIDLLQKLLFSLPKRRKHENKVNRAFEFLVEDIFNVPGVGPVVSGFVNAGDLTVGSSCNVFVGPTDDGTFMKTVAKSAHIARINTSHITSGQSACLALALGKDLRKKLRRGMVVLRENPTSTRHFDAEVCVLKGEGTTIRQSYQAFIHVLNVRQSAYARNIEIVSSSNQQHHRALRTAAAEDGIVLRPGSRAKVSFEFAKRPEYIRPGMRMLFRDGCVRGIGIITAISDEA